MRHWSLMKHGRRGYISFTSSSLGSRNVTWNTCTVVINIRMRWRVEELWRPLSRFYKSFLTDFFIKTPGIRGELFSSHWERGHSKVDSRLGEIHRRWVFHHIIRLSIASLNVAEAVVTLLSSPRDGFRNKIGLEAHSDGTRRGAKKKKNEEARSSKDPLRKGE